MQVSVHVRTIAQILVHDSATERNMSILDMRFGSEHGVIMCHHITVMACMKCSSQRCILDTSTRASQIGRASCHFDLHPQKIHSGTRMCSKRQHPVAIKPTLRTTSITGRPATPRPTTHVHRQPIRHSTRSKKRSHCTINCAFKRQAVETTAPYSCSGLPAPPQDQPPCGVCSTS
jgi:hypothetical protein